MTKHSKFKNFVGNGYMYLKFKEFQSRGTFQRALIDSVNSELKNVVIEGLLILKSKIIDSEITIERTKIKGYVDYSYATFKQVLSFKNSTFETDANFTAATAEKDIFLDEATFLGAANFLDLTVGGVFYGNSTIFKKEANFNRATFEKGISFKKNNFEEGDADFGSTWIGSSPVVPLLVAGLTGFLKR